MLTHTDFVHFENGATKSQQKETIGQYDQTIFEIPNEKNDLSEDSHCTDNNWKKNQAKVYKKRPTGLDQCGGSTK